MTAIKLHLLINPKFLGEKNQALGIKTMLEKQCAPEKIETKEWDDSKDEMLAVRTVANLKYNAAFDSKFSSIIQHFSKTPMTIREVLNQLQKTADQQQKHQYHLEC